MTSFASGKAFQKSKLENFLKDVKKTSFFDFPSRELTLCLASNSSSIDELRALPVTPRTNMSLLSILTHLAAVSFVDPKKFGLFKALMVSPQTMQNKFLPTMPDDPRMQLARMFHTYIIIHIITHIIIHTIITTTTEEYLKSLPGHGVYLSSKGHIYTVPPCGLPMR